MSSLLRALTKRPFALFLPLGFAFGGWAAERFGAPLVFIFGGELQTLLVLLGLLHPRVRSVD